VHFIFNSQLLAMTEKFELAMTFSWYY